MDGLHSWVLQRIRQGNQRDEAQTISAIIDFMEDEESKKTNGSIKRFFVISKILREPRIGLKNASAIQNQMIRMVSYDIVNARLTMSSIPCQCNHCLEGQFQQCIKYKHEVVYGTVQKDSTAKNRKIDGKNKEEYLNEELEFEEYLQEWDQQFIDTMIDENALIVNSDGENTQNISSNLENTDNLEDKLQAEIIEDDPDYWPKREEFIRHLKEIFISFKETHQFEEFKGFDGTYAEYDLNGLNEVWECINEDQSDDQNYEIGCLDNLTIKRSDFQQCSSDEWFGNEIINLAFKNIGFRSTNRKIVVLRCEVIQTIQV